MKNTGACQGHDDAGHGYAQRNGQRRRLDAHVQKTGCQRASPCAGTGNGDPHKQQKRQKQPPSAGFAPQLLQAAAQENRRQR